MRLVATCLSLWLGIGVAVAATDAEIDRYWELADLDEYVTQVVEEGLAWGDQVDSDYLSGQGGARWKDAVAQIYDGERITRELRDELRSELGSVDLTPTLVFLSSDLGRRVVPAEYAAWESLLNDWGAWEKVHRITSRPDLIPPKRKDLLARLLVAGDSLEMAVAYTLESDRVFVRAAASEDGRVAGGLTLDEHVSWMDAGEMVRRDEVESWMIAVNYFAHRDLSDDDLERLVEFYEREETIAVTKARSRAGDKINYGAIAAVGTALAQTFDEASP